VLQHHSDTSRVTMFAAAVAALVGATAPAPARAEPGSCFAGDYPKIRLPPLDYRKAFARSAFSPAQIIIGRKKLWEGASPAQVSAVLGGQPVAVGKWQTRRAEEQCRYTVEILQQDPHSMNVYRWMDLRRKRLSGLFQVTEWRLGKLGRVRAFLHKRAEKDTPKAWLFQVVLPAVPVAEVPYRNGPRRLVREGPPRIEWNLASDKLVLPASVME